MNDNSVTPDDSEPISVDECYCLSMRKASRKLIRFYDQHLEPYGLTIGQFGLLALIARMREASVQVLSDAMELDQSAASRALAPLVRDGLVVSRSDDKDGRKRIVILSDAGRTRLGLASVAWKAAQDEISNRADSLDLLAAINAIDEIGARR